jgi:hypothetical protein
LILAQQRLLSFLLFMSLLLGEMLSLSGFFGSRSKSLSLSCFLLLMFMLALDMCSQAFVG